MLACFIYPHLADRQADLERMVSVQKVGRAHLLILSIAAAGKAPALVMRKETATLAKPTGTPYVLSAEAVAALQERLPPAEVSEGRPASRRRRAAVSDSGVKEGEQA